MDAVTIRNLVKEVSGKEVTTTQAAHFLELFGEELESDLVKTRRQFVERHFGTKAVSR